MKTVRLGKTGIAVSELCIGTSLFGRQRLHLPEDEASAIIGCALDAGVNFIDTAKHHQTYTVIQHALKNVQKDIVIMSRSFGEDYEQMEKDLYEGLHALKRDAVDVFLMHGVTNEDDIAGRAWAWRAIRDFKEAGAIRAAGVSTWTVPGIQATLVSTDIADLEVLFVPFNRIGFGLHEGSLDEASEALEKLHDNGIGIIATSVLGAGFIPGPMEEAINFVRSKPFIDAMRLNLRSLEHLKAALHVLNDEQVPDELRKAIDAEARRLWVFDWCTACGKCVDVCPENALSIGGWWSGKTAKVDTAKCTLCGKCGPICPVSCLHVF